MKNSGITDPHFRQAIEAIDSGNINELENLIAEHPRLIKERLHTNGDGYFKKPYLLWFVADNPIRTGKLADNIVEVTRLLIQSVKKLAPETFLNQINYTLGLVATGRTPRECGVQIALIDLLIDGGAIPGNGLGALANGNLEAARHLLNRGGKPTLAAAVCLEPPDEMSSLGATASAAEKLTALAAAAFYGKADSIKLLLQMGANPDGYPESNSGFHSHATPLHQAVSSGSLDAVKLLVEAGANTGATDKIYSGTPLDWADYLQREAGGDEAARENFALIETYLQGLN